MAAAGVEVLARRIDVALGRAPADLVVTGGRLLDVGRGVVSEAAVTIVGDTIVAVGEPRAATRTLDAGGRFVTPGLIDAHVHIESSMVLPQELERAILPRGTTTLVWDPHEIANVLGADGIRAMLEQVRDLALGVVVNLSSCVPATAFETAGAALDAAALGALLDDPAVHGLAEVMSVAGLLAKEPEVLAKLWAFRRFHIDGHAPLLRGPALDAYLSTGIATDHECTTLDEAREKLAKGMAILMREGSVAKNVTALAPLLDQSTWPRIAFCTDDRNPLEIAAEGHVDHALRLAIRAGAPVMPAWRAATLGASMIFGLRDRGLVAPGRRADLLLVDDLAEVRVTGTVASGRVVEPALFEGRPAPAPVGLGSVRREPVVIADFAVPARSVGPWPVIGVVQGSLLTEELRLELPRARGQLHAFKDRGVLKAAVLERHGAGGRIGRGFVKGFGCLAGAIATSVGHDSHNITVVGDNDMDMAAAVNRLIAMGGGCVVVGGSRVLAELVLPVAGLMSDRPLEEVSAALKELRIACRAIGCTLDEPLLQLAFLPLPVIPHLKLTDHGLVRSTAEGLELVDW